MLLAVGTSWRTAEPIAIRRHDDIRLFGGRVKLRVGGTIVRNGVHGLHRQDSPKSEKQRRWMTLPDFPAEVVRRRMAWYRDNPEGLLFATRTGRPYEQNNIGRLLRGFREAYREELEAVGIDVNLLTFRAFRKDAATLVADELGVEAAAELLGHAGTDTTEKHYSKPREKEVDAAVTEVINKRMARIMGNAEGTVGD